MTRPVVRPAALVFGTTVSVMGAVLFWFGPAVHPDTAGYVAFAHAILAEGHRAGVNHLGSFAISPLLARAPGYPLFLAFCMAAGGEVWPWLATSMQVLGLGLALTLLTVRLAASAGKPWPLAIGMAASAATGLTHWATSLLTEGIYLPLLCVALALLLGPPGSRRGDTLRALASGLVVAAALLVREGTVVLAAAFVPAMVLRRSPCMAILRLAVFAAPISIAVAALLAWNEGRTGTAFLTTSAQWTLPEALLVASRRSFDLVYREDEPFTAVARSVLRQHELAEVYEMNRILFERHGMNAVEQARAAQVLFVETWLRAPLTLAALAAGRLDAGLMGIVFEPFKTLGAIARMAGRDWPLFVSLTRAWRTALTGDPATIMIAFGIIVSRVVAFAIWLSAARATLRSVRRWRNPEPDSHVGLALALFVVLWVTLCLPFRVNDRYLSPIIPAVLGLAGLGSSGRPDRPEGQADAEPTSFRSRAP